MIAEFIEEHITRTKVTVTVASGCCKNCSAPYADCRYPVSHGVPSIDAIKLPAEANNIALRYKNGESTAKLTSYEREVWDRSAILGHANF